MASIDEVFSMIQNRPPQAQRLPMSRAGLIQREQPQRANWWIRTTTWGWDQPRVTVEARERARRSQLTSLIIVTLLLVAIVLLPLGINDPSSLASVLVFIVGLLIALGLNRAGWVTAAGWLLVALVCGAVVGALVTQQGGLTVDALLGFDLLLIALVVAAFVLPRSAVLWVGAINVALIAAVYALSPRATDLAALIQFYDGEVGGALAVLSRPLALEILIGVVAYLARRGIDAEIRRADRAEEIAALEHTLADQKRQLDIGIQQILQTHVRAANGDYSARAPLGQDNLLWQIASSLNNLLSRLQRTGQAEYQLRRTDEELRRLAAAIDDAQAGRKPVWPAPTGTSADFIIERITRTGRRAQPIVQEHRPPSGPSQPMSGFPPGGPHSWQDQMRPAPQAPAGWPDQAQPAQPVPPPPFGWQDGPPQPQQPAELQQDGGWSPQMDPSIGGGAPPSVNPWAFPQDDH
jgi:hypothetical protein